jgi:hypothetical protein
VLRCVEELQRAADLQLRVGGHGLHVTGAARTRSPPQEPSRLLIVVEALDHAAGRAGVGRKRRGDLLVRLGLDPAAPEEPTALGLALRPGGHLGCRGLADPALVLRPRRAQLAHEAPLARRRQVRLRPLALEHRAMAHVAGDVMLRYRIDVDLLLHEMA